MFGDKDDEIMDILKSRVTDDSRMEDLKNELVQQIKSGEDPSQTIKAIKILTELSKDEHYKNMFMNNRIRNADLINSVTNSNTHWLYLYGFAVVLLLISVFFFGGVSKTDHPKITNQEQHQS